MAYLPRRLLEKIPYLEALTSSRWAQGSHDRYELPSVPEFHDLSVFVELIQFANSKPEEYTAPPEHSRAFSLVRLADLMGVDGYLTLMAAKLGVPANRIDNSNSIKTVRAIIRNRYRASVAGGRKFEGLCRKCRQPLAACPPERTRVTTTLCCQQQVHSDCRVKSELSCIVCEQSFVIFLCVVCRCPISYPECSPAEAYHLYAKPHQLPCCSADCHAQCRARLSAGRCSCCSMPLRRGGESIDEEDASAIDYLYMHRERRLNDHGRRKQIVDYTHPPGQINWSRNT